MAVQFPLDKAFLVAGWVGGALWGMYTVVFSAWIYILLHKPKNSIAKPLIIATIVLYTMSTLNVALTITRLIEAFITYRKVLDPIIYFITIPVGPHVGHALDFIYSINLIVGDALVVWRCWIVWAKNWYIIAFPMLLLLGSATVSLASPISTVVPNPDETVGIAFGTSMFVLSFVTNVFVTFLTAGKIWWTARRNTIIGSSSLSLRYRGLLVLILESGIVMAAVKTIEFTLFRISPNDGLEGNNALYIVFDAMPHLTGLIPTVMVVTVALGLTAVESTSARTMSSSQVGGIQFAANVQLGTLSDTSRDIHSSRIETTSELDQRNSKKADSFSGLEV